MGNQKNMKNYIAIPLLGISLMTHAEPDIVYQYSTSVSLFYASHSGPTTEKNYAVTSDNKALFADLAGMKTNKDGASRPNPNFGIYTYPLSEGQITEIKKTNSLLNNPSKMKDFKKQGYEEFGYELKPYNKGGRVSGEFFGYTNEMLTDPKNTPKDIDRIKTGLQISNAMKSLIDTRNKNKQLYATSKITYSLIPQEKSLRVNVNIKVIGDVNGAVSNPSRWVKPKEGERVDGYDEYMYVLYTGFYKDKAYTENIFLLPEYLVKNSLSETENKSGSSLFLNPNSTRTLSFDIPYKNISFYSHDDEKKLAWNEGNRTKDGHILVDHSVLQGNWYLNMSLSIFSNYVLNLSEDFIQLK